MIFVIELYGEGEWKVRKHGYSKRRTWCKVHLAMDAKTGQVCVALMTHQDVDDSSALPDLLDQIPSDMPIESIGSDGAYDTKRCHATIAARGGFTVDSAARRRDAMARKYVRCWLAQRCHRRHCAKRPTGMEEGQRLPSALACREPDVPARDAHGQSLVGAPHRFAGDRSCDSRGLAQPHDGPRSPAVRSHRLNSSPLQPLCFQIRFMQQRRRKAIDFDCSM